jgi:hypothetical protein
VPRRLGTAAVPAEDLADVPYTPRRPVVAPEEPTGVFAFAVTIVAFLGAAAAALGVEHDLFRKSVPTFRDHALPRGPDRSPHATVQYSKPGGARPPQ